MFNINNIRVGRLNNYKNNSGKFCFINYFHDDNDLSKDLSADNTKFNLIKNEDKLIINLPKSRVAFDTNLDYDKPNLFINLNNKDLISFNNSLKDIIINSVYNINLYGKDLETLAKFYNDPIQIKQKTGKKLLKLKILKQRLASPIDILQKGSMVNLNIHVSGIWFNGENFGPYYNIVDLKKLN